MIKIGFKLDILELGLETQLSFRERIAPVFLGAVLTVQECRGNSMSGALTCYF